MGRFGDTAIEEVRQRADIVEVISAHVRLRRTGRNFVGLCPFHNEKTPSFSVNPERGFFHCFGCGAGGTVFNFVMRLEGLTFPEAVRSLARRFGVALAELNGEGGPGAKEREALSRANQVGAEFFFHVLWNTADGAPAREYLKSREITPEAARAFMLGYAPPRPASLAKALERRGLSEAGLKLGLVKRAGAELHDSFRSRVIFPIRDAQGRVLAFGGRVLDDRLPKYLNSPESPLYSKTRTLYGLYEARQAVSACDRAIVVEGYFDVIALWQAGFKETVASCGTSLTAEQLRILSRHTKNIVACFDGDDAGRKASLRALEVFLEAGLLGSAVFIPGGFDPDTLVRERGGAALQDALDSSRLLIDYFLDELGGEDRRSVAARTRVASRIAEMLRPVRDELLFDSLVARAAERIGIKEEILRRAAKPVTRSKMGGSGRRESPGSAVAFDAGTVAELGLVAIAVSYPAFRSELRAEWPTENFENPILATLFEEASVMGAARADFKDFMAERLPSELSARVAAFAFDSLIDEEAKARDQAHKYILGLKRRRDIYTETQLKREAAAAQEPAHYDDALRAAQAALALKRERARRAGSS